MKTFCANCGEIRDDQWSRSQKNEWTPQSSGGYWLRTVVTVRLGCCNRTLTAIYERGHVVVTHRETQGV